MRKAPLVFCFALVLAVWASWAPKAQAFPSLYDSNCAGCHGTTQTCNGCHSHGTHSDSTKSDINVTGTTDKTTYAPGETVSVTIDGGYRTGWIRTSSTTRTWWNWPEHRLGGYGRHRSLLRPRIPRNADRPGAHRGWNLHLERRLVR